MANQTDFAATYTTVNALMGNSNSVGEFSEGDSIRAGNFEYAVAADGATDYHAITSAGAKLYAKPLADGSIHSTQLGWHAGENVSDEFARLFEGAMGAGDTLVLDHMFDIEGSEIQLPENFTLAGADGGGLDIQDTSTNPDPLLFLNDGVSLVDLSFVHLNEPDGKGSKILLKSIDNDDVKIINSSFEGNANIFVEFVDGDRLLVQDTSFDGGYYQMRWSGDVLDAKVVNSLFQNSLGDGIKTAPSNGKGVQRAEVIDSVFIRNDRDGIDTTGGFKDSVVSGSHFIENGEKGIDIKTIVDDRSDLSTDQMNENILISDSTFVDNNKAVALTTLNRANLLGDNVAASEWAANSVHLENIVVENTSSSWYQSVIAVNDSRDVTWDGMKLVGNLHIVGSDGYDRYIGVGGTDVVREDSSGTLSTDFTAIAGHDAAASRFSPDLAAEVPMDEPDPVDPSPGLEPAPETEVEEDASIQQRSPEETMLVESDYLDIHLVMTDTGESIQLNEPFLASSLAELDGNVATLVATAKDGVPADIGSVSLSIDGVNSRVENVEPYALFGDHRGELYDGHALSAGEYDISMTVYSKRGGNGVVLEEITATLEYGQDPVVEPERPLEDVGTLDAAYMDIFMYFTDTGETVHLNDETETLHLGDIEGRQMTIFASAKDGERVGSVALDWDGAQGRVENVEPYALFGDDSLHFGDGKRISEGTFDLSVDVFSEGRARGDLLEDLDLTLEIRSGAGGTDGQKIAILSDAQIMNAIEGGDLLDLARDGATASTEVARDQLMAISSDPTFDTFF